ncbi:MULTISPECIES: hypothetical protein [unclassified Sphingobacterium]|nr:MULTISPECIES: hypothetical protein [unclassified Sphingobacterium]
MTLDVAEGALFEAEAMPPLHRGIIASAKGNFAVVMKISIGFLI